ncbi:cytochrome c [Alphaproteobacteria bacterium]|nr:cytochrome c [Alphaproteobacteria bacterium]
MKINTFVILAGLVALSPFVAMLQTSHAHEPEEGTVEAERVNGFKASAKGIQAVFKVHLPAKDYAAIAEYAEEMALWGKRLPSLFPEGSESEYADKDIWENWEDFETKAENFVAAAEALSKQAEGGDAKAIAASASALGATCKSCHKPYRIKH